MRRTARGRVGFFDGSEVNGARRLASGPERPTRAALLGGTTVVRARLGQRCDKPLPCLTDLGWALVSTRYNFRLGRTTDRLGTA